MRNYEQLWKMCQRRTKTEGDADALAGFKEDINMGIQEIVALRDWQELEKKDTLLVTSGTDTYALNTTVNLNEDYDVIKQVLIISPTGNETEVFYIDKEQLRKIDPVASNSGTGTPRYWYYNEPTIITGNETRNMTLWPVPNASYTLQISYKRIPSDMSAGSDRPFFDKKLHHILVDYAVWNYCLREPDSTLNPSTFEANWENGKRRLLSSVHSQAPLQPIPGPDSP